MARGLSENFIPSPSTTPSGYAVHPSREGNRGNGEWDVVFCWLGNSPPWRGAIERWRGGSLKREDSSTPATKNNPENRLRLRGCFHQLLYRLLANLPADHAARGGRPTVRAIVFRVNNSASKASTKRFWVLAASVSETVRIVKVNLFPPGR